MPSFDTESDEFTVVVAFHRYDEFGKNVKCISLDKSSRRETLETYLFESLEVECFEVYSAYVGDCV